MTIIVTAALSGVIGAIAGGAVSLISQFLLHKWQNQDRNHIYKKELYSEIAGIGNHYVGWDVFEKINNDMAKALLVCGNKLKPKLINYCAAIEELNNLIDGKPLLEKQKIINEHTFKNASLHNEMLQIMREELDII